MSVVAILPLGSHPAPKAIIVLSSSGYYIMLLPSRLVLSDDSDGLLAYRHRSGIMDTPHSLESRDLGTPGTRVLSIILAMKGAIGSLELGWIPLLLAVVVAGCISLRLLFHASRKGLGRILGGSGLLMSSVVDGGREPASEAPNESELAEVMFACLRLLEYKAAIRVRELQQVLFSFVYPFCD
ncbi:hypothetical protein BKA70DRAFT_361033 [Coprinopsis sp. MPI-PUGE-AT-0042]|nr:hypothetical protein BKA70DRAFT_361033 [Coprinopsis sp. MPI-PUGE-AT-0042]